MFAVKEGKLKLSELSVAFQNTRRKTFKSNLIVVVIECKGL